MKLSKYFSLVEMTYLPQWKRCAFDQDGLNDEVIKNLTTLCLKLDVIREHFGHPITVHCAYRPKGYNSLVGGAPNSSHLQGMAIDFSIKGISCDDVRSEILKQGFLQSLELRMEDLPKSKWVHLDIRQPGVSGKRFFKP